MPALSNAFRRKIFSPSTNEDVIRLVTITHPDWLEPLRYCDVGLELDTTISTHVARYTMLGGERYEEMIVSSRSPDDVESELPSVPLALAGAAATLLEEDLTEATVDLVLVAKSDPNEIVEEMPDWGFVSGEASREVVSFELSLEPDDQNEPAVAYTMNKSNARGLFL